MSIVMEPVKLASILRAEQLPSIRHRSNGRLPGVRCLGAALVPFTETLYQSGAKAPHSRETPNLLRVTCELGCALVMRRCIECRCPLAPDSLFRTYATIYRTYC